MINQFDETKDFMYENGFYLTSQPYRLGNMLAHYELYKKITQLPGDVIELGVFKGGGLVQWATFRELLENENSRKIVGFDTFGEFPVSGEIESDKEFIDKWNVQFKDEFVAREEIYKSLEWKGIGNVELVQGDILQTLPKYLEGHRHMKISLLHIDTDVYEPCKIGLELLYERVVPGGVIVFDDYATIEGETLAVDEFFANRKHSFQKFPFSYAKPVYMIRE
ncbi:TylF/MycF/NovP-related O-methyltransferase [Lachnospiraceae bacterium 29-84]